MPLFPEHAPRRRLLDVAELLGEQVVKLDKAQSNVTPDEYRKSQQERAAQSKAYAEEQGKKHPTKSPAQKPPEPGFFETIPKLPGKLVSAAGAAIPEGVKSAKIPSWLLPGPPGMKVGEATRGMIDIASPIDLSEKANYGSQALGAAAALTGARLATVLANLRKLKTAANVAHDAAKARSAAKSAADAARARSQKQLEESSRMFGGTSGATAGGVAGSSATEPAARSTFLGGLKSAIADGLRTKVGLWPKGIPGVGLGAGLGYVIGHGVPSISTLWQKTGEALGLGEALRNRPPDLPEKKPNEAPGPASPAEKPKPANVVDELREAGRQQLDPRHGGPRGVNEQGLPEFKLPRPSPEELANVRGIGNMRALRNDAEFAAMRSEYMTLKNKVKILNDRRIPLENGLTEYELDRWNDFNSADSLTTSGKSIFDVEAAKNARP